MDRFCDRFRDLTQTRASHHRKMADDRKVATHHWPDASDSHELRGYRRSIGICRRGNLGDRGSGAGTRRDRYRPCSRRGTKRASRSGPGRGRRAAKARRSRDPRIPPPWPRAPWWEGPAMRTSRVPHAGARRWRSRRRRTPTRSSRRSAEDHDRLVSTGRAAAIGDKAGAIEESDASSWVRPTGVRRAVHAATTPFGQCTSPRSGAGSAAGRAVRSRFRPA